MHSEEWFHRANGLIVQAMMNERQQGEAGD